MQTEFLIFDRDVVKDGVTYKLDAEAVVAAAQGRVVAISSVALPDVLLGFLHPGRKLLGWATLESRQGEVWAVVRWIGEAPELPFGLTPTFRAPDGAIGQVIELSPAPGPVPCRRAP